MNSSDYCIQTKKRNYNSNRNRQDKIYVDNNVDGDHNLAATCNYLSLRCFLLSLYRSVSNVKDVFDWRLVRAIQGRRQDWRKGGAEKE